MKTDYTTLDAAILAHIRSGSPVHPMYARDCITALTLTRVEWVHHPHKIADRMQTLRKAGKIRHVRPIPAGVDHGWTIVEDQADA